MAFNFSQSNKALPLKTRINIRDNAESFEVSFAAIRAASGIDFAFEVHGDVVAFNKAIDKPYEDRLGEIFFGSSSGVLQSLVACVTNGCVDALVQEDFQDACSAKLLVFRVKLEGWPGGLFHPLSIENGVLFVDFYSDTVWSSVDEVGCTKFEDIPRISALDMPPVAAMPVVLQPAVTKPVALQPAVVKPVAYQPVASQPVALQPVASQPAVVKPVAFMPTSISNLVHPSTAVQSMECAQPSVIVTAMALVDQNGLVVGHWKVGICDCCTDVVPNACMSCICPWVSLAQIVHRIGLYSYFSALLVIGVVYLAPVIAYSLAKDYVEKCYRYAQYGYVDVEACRNADISQAIGSLAYVATGLIVWVIRNNVRRVFQIRGNACEDCLYACCCSCCTIAQMASHTDAYIKGAFCNFRPRNTLPGYVQR